MRNEAGAVTELWLAGSKLLPEAQFAKEVLTRYAAPVARKRRATG